MPPPPAEFSGSDEDVDEEEVDPEEEDGDVTREEMVAMEGEEDLDEEDGLGKSFPVKYPLVLSVSHHGSLACPMLNLEMWPANITMADIVHLWQVAQICFEKLTGGRSRVDKVVSVRFTDNLQFRQVAEKHPYQTSTHRLLTCARSAP